MGDRAASGLDATAPAPQNRGMTEGRQYRSLEASELFCPTCRRAQPVHQHLLLVLPTGNKYEYRCAVCSTPVGAKDDSDSSEYRSLLSGRRLT